MNLQNVIQIPILLVCIGLSPHARAVLPAPDGGYPGGNTAEGQSALLSLSTGGFNTAVGFLSLSSNTAGSFNTGVGAGALLANVGDSNDGNENTATGAGALLSNSTGADNTANGAFALFNNNTGDDNTANGTRALFSNTDGRDNTATGISALRLNDTGDENTATGIAALANNTTGNGNTAIGSLAGLNQTTGFNNVYIGKNVLGVAGENNACYILSIFGQTSASGIPILINSNNKLGTTTSSRRFKEEIKLMDNASEALFALNPVTFRYKKEIDPTATPQFGLVAEEVEKVNPDLIVRDKEGKAYSVRYDQVNAMLLNEFLKEHRAFLDEQCKMQELEANAVRQEANVAQQQKQIEALTAGLQKVSAQLAAASPSRGRLEASSVASKVAVNP